MNFNYFMHGACFDAGSSLSVQIEYEEGTSTVVRTLWTQTGETCILGEYSLPLLSMQGTRVTIGKMQLWLFPEESTVDTRSSSREPWVQTHRVSFCMTSVWTILKS
jgi:hypothetical protein